MSGCGCSEILVFPAVYCPYETSCPDHDLTDIVRLLAWSMRVAMDAGACVYDQTVNSLGERLRADCRSLAVIWCCDTIPLLDTGPTHYLNIDSSYLLIDTELDTKKDIQTQYSHTLGTSTLFVGRYFYPWGSYQIHFNQTVTSVTPVFNSSHLLHWSCAGVFQFCHKWVQRNQYNQGCLWNMWSGCSVGSIYVYNWHWIIWLQPACIVYNRHWSDNQRIKGEIVTMLRQTICGFLLLGLCCCTFGLQTNGSEEVEVSIGKIILIYQLDGLISGNSSALAIA